MHLLVRPLRVRGRRLSSKEIANGPQYYGDVRTSEIQLNGKRVRAITLAGLDPMVRTPLLDLFEPALVGIAPLAMQIRGIERHECPDGAYSVIQEWRCEAARHEK